MRSFLITFDVNYYDKSALVNLNLCLAIKQHPITLWKTGLMNSIVDDTHSKTSFVKVVQKQPLGLIMQDRHVTYSEIEAYLGRSLTSIPSILHEQLAPKKICFRWIPNNLWYRSKKVHVDWSKQMFEKYDRGRSLHVTTHGSMRMSPKQNNSPQCGFSKTSQIQRKLFVEEALRSR